MTAPTLNVFGAPSRLLAKNAVRRGYCLAECGKVILDGRPALVHAITALNEWYATPAEFRHDGAGPKGSPVYFSGAGGAGDVALSDGNGRTVSTIDPSRAWGRTGHQSVASREAQLGGKLLGHATWFAGYRTESLSPAELKHLAHVANVKRVAAWLNKQLVTKDGHAVHTSASTTGKTDRPFWYLLKAVGKRDGVWTHAVNHFHGRASVRLFRHYADHALVTPTPTAP